MITDIETAFDLDKNEAAALLGLDRRRYWEFATGRRELPSYLEASVRAHLALKPTVVKRFVRESAQA